jgi:hypothetical protein
MWDSREPAEALRTVLRGSVEQYMQNGASELRRIPLPRTSVNENVPRLSAPLSVALSSKAQKVRIGLDQPIVVLLGGFEESPSP